VAIISCRLSYHPTEKLVALAGLVIGAATHQVFPTLTSRPSTSSTTGKAGHSDSSKVKCLPKKGTSMRPYLFFYGHSIPCTTYYHCLCQTGHVQTLHKMRRGIALHVRTSARHHQVLGKFCRQRSQNAEMNIAWTNEHRDIQVILRQAFLRLKLIDCNERAMEDDTANL
jgi:hypothetical protein